MENSFRFSDQKQLKKVEPVEKNNLMFTSDQSFGLHHIFDIF